MSVTELVRMNTNIHRIIFLAAIALALAGCQNMGSRSSAPIVDKSPPAGKAAEVSRPRAAAPKGHYIVQRGDTLFRIAQEVGQSISDLVAWNNLADPNDIKVDQLLRVIPPEGAAKAQPAPVASSSSVEVRPSGSTESSSPNKAESAKEGSAAGEEGRSALKGMSWMWPTEGSILQSYTPSRKGIAIAGEMGQPVVAAGPGTVLYASSVRGYGNLVIVKHTNTLLSAYAHNKTILVKEGQTVSRGQKIAEMGDSDTDRVKLHFEIREQGKPVDPTKYLPNR